MRHPDRLRDEDRQQLARVCALCPELDAASRLVRAFAEILTTRSGHLNDWITAVRAEGMPGLPGLHTFATVLEKDWDAVLQGLTGPDRPLELRTCRWPRQAHQDDQAPDVRLCQLPLLRKRVLLTALAS